MSMQDPIADMITRIRNAQSAGEQQVCIPASNFKAAILDVLRDEGYISSYTLENEDGKKNLTVKLKYSQSQPVISKITRVSRPGLRIYKGREELPTVRAGMGIAIITTPKGVMTERAARSQELGGEVVCFVE